MLLVGIDPDSKKHGLAICRGRKLLTLASVETDVLVSRLVVESQLETLLIKIDDVRAPAAFFRPGMNHNQMLKISKNVAACKLAATELIKRLTSAGLNVNLIRPLESNERRAFYDHVSFWESTGWSASTNADKRSAAMVALLGQAKSGDWLYSSKGVLCRS